MFFQFLLAYTNFSSSNIDNELTNVIYFNPTTSRVINHNVMAPSSLGLTLSASTSSQSSQARPAANVPVKRKVGRPRNDSKRPIEKEEPFEDDEMISHRTKSGRLIKLNPEIAKIFQIDQDTPTPMVVQPVVHQPIVEVPKPEPKLLPGLKEPPKKPRKISSEFRCKTCKKIYLGKNKMAHHFKLFPDHRPKAPENESVLFSQLMTMVQQKKKNKDMANLFFKEISNFVQLCEKLTPKLITNKDDHPNTHHHIVDKNAASLLRINPGNYRLNMDVFDKNFQISPDKPEKVPEEEHEHELASINSSEEHHDDHHDHHHQAVVSGNEVIKALDDVPSLDGNEVNLLIRQTPNELTNLTNISDIVGETDKIEQHIDDNALLGFLN